MTSKPRNLTFTRLTFIGAVLVALTALVNVYYGGKTLAGTETTTTTQDALEQEWRLQKEHFKERSTPKVPDVVHANDPITDDPSFIPRREPTNNACDGYEGIYHIAMGDIGGAAGTIFFQFVIGQLIYADRNNLKPWVHFDNVSYIVYDPVVHGRGKGVKLKALSGRNATHITRPNGHWRDQHPGPLDSTQPVHKTDFHFEGTGVWEHYFEPLSDFIPGDRSCESKLYTTLDLKLITPGIHGFSDWAPRCWRYEYLPDYITKPHIPLTEWLEPQRQIGYETVQKYIRFRPYMQQAASKANPDCGPQNPCLGLHIRHSDKSAGRRVIETEEFLPFALAFLHAGGKHIYLATDSSQVLQEVQTLWPVHVRDRVRTIGDHIVRSSDDKAVFDLGSHHRTNQEVLIEILALSQCQFLVHGLSAVSESSIWMNIDLHVRSANLEDPDHISAASFGTMVQMVSRGEPEDHLPRPVRSDDWWKGAPVAKQPEQQRACEGYDGILHIGAVGNSASTGAAFFTSVLNQLIYANMYNLKPWIHLSNATSELVFDQDAHGIGSRISLEMVAGMKVGVDSITNTGEYTYPSRPLRVVEKPLATTATISLGDEYAGNGIWSSYFEPVSDFVPGDVSCRDKPLLSMEEPMVTFGLQLHSPWSVKAWRYDKMPEAAWKPDSKSLKEWYEPMRRRAHEAVMKYYRFQPHIIRRAEEANLVVQGEPCLAIHLRNNDKTGRYRAKVKMDKFEGYVDAFERAGGRAVYIAADSNRVLQYIRKNYPERLTKLIRTQGNAIVRADKLIRSKKDFPTHMLDNHHRVNSEALVDILAMSKCSMLLHGFSTVSEASIYLNPTLHNNSVNLEDPHRLTAEEFERLARDVIAKASTTIIPTSSVSDQTKTVDGDGELTALIDRLDNTTMLTRGSRVSRKCRSNAIVYLAQKQHSSYGRDSFSSLLRSLDLLYKNYLSIARHVENTDIFIFHTGDFNAADLHFLESRFGSSYRGVIRLVDLSGSPYWARPKHHLNDDPNTWYAYPLFSEGYRRMMHWFAIDIWQYFDRLNHETACGYRYLFRLDEDSFIHSPIEYDVFDMMQSKQYLYGYRMCAYEMKVVQRMWTRWGKKHLDFVPQRKIDLEMCGIYNNFFVVDIELFNRPDVKAFLHFIDIQGQIYRRRLGDLMIHSMVVYGFAAQDRVHRFLDFTYEHGTANQTDGCLIWGGIQAGYSDANATQTLSSYYDSMMLSRKCPGNATFLQEEDLSPSFAHIPDELRGKVSLHTITAGRVELPDKGILSG